MKNLTIKKYKEMCEYYSEEIEFIDLYISNKKLSWDDNIEESYYTDLLEELNNDFKLDGDIENLTEYLDQFTDIAGSRYDKKHFDSILEVQHGDDRQFNNFYEFYHEFDLINLDNYTFYYGATLESVAELLVSDGIWGAVDNNLLYYIDFEKLGNDLSHDGYTETNYGVIFSQY